MRRYSSLFAVALVVVGLCAGPALAAKPEKASVKAENASAKPENAVKAENTPAKPDKADQAVDASRPDIKNWQLDNGLEVLFLADHRVPAVAVQVFYHVGSKDEPRQLRGIAHMFEHMMFKGSAHVRPEEHARAISSVGGDSNGFTTEDVTAFTNTVPREHLGFALKLEAERMRNLLLIPSTVNSEREVVKEEKRMRVDSNPMGRVRELFSSIAFTEHPYAWGPAGFLEDLDRVTPADCQLFYDTYYVPNNATLVVVGDVTEEEARRVVQQEFGAIARGPAAPRVTTREPPQTAIREQSVDYQANLPMLFGGYHIPEAGHPDMPALQVVAQVLSAGQTSRLFQRLVYKDRLALFAGGIPRVMEQPGMFLLFAGHLPTIDQAKVRAALLEEIERVRKDGISAKELEKAKNQLTMSYLDDLGDVTGIATTLGHYQYVFGGWQKFPDSLGRYQKVTSEDAKRVAQQYLASENLTLISVVPAQMKGGAQ